MAITKGAWLRSISQTCIDCGGKCFDRDNSVRQENFHKKFPGKITPNDCVGSDNPEEPTKCPFQN